MSSALLNEHLPEELECKVCGKKHPTDEQIIVQIGPASVAWACKNTGMARIVTYTKLAAKYGIDVG